MSQLALPIRLSDHAVFETFHPAGNEQLVAYLERLAEGETAGGCWVAGAYATGKTHLLQATCERAGDDAVYLPADLLTEAGVGLLEGLETRRIVAIDNIETLLAAPDWETALFALYNRLQEAGASLIVSATNAPRALSVDLPDLLPDLVSRLSQLPTFSIQPLSDEDRKKALQIRAANRGLELPDETAQYLVTRIRRDMGSLYDLLDTLDQEALRAQRRLTVPFVKDVLSS
ncbi:MAG: DnaA regulatory inactivator Hda [Woeseiaceae bacterium]|nr:DnaA regulatory inactivator Hda [Woeseiaceae bacterium]